MLAAQGADLAAFNRQLALDHTAPVVLELNASEPGFVSHCDARTIGEVIRDLGGGRRTKDSAINYDVGVDRLAKRGERVRAGSVLARIHGVTIPQAEDACGRLEASFKISAASVKPVPLIVEMIAA